MGYGLLSSLLSWSGPPPLFSSPWDPAATLTPPSHTPLIPLSYPSPPPPPLIGDTVSEPAAVASAVETGQMSSAETGQMSAVETGQMSAAETGQMSAAETRQLSTIETGQIPVPILYI